MTRPLRDKFLDQTRREYRPEQRMLALAGLGVFFLIVLPFVLVRLGAVLDRWLGLPALVLPPFNAILGGLGIFGGWLIAMWSIYVQFTIGRGTPVPLMATQKLIIQPPYSHTRNPMVLGTLVAFLGLAVLFGSLGLLLLVLVLSGLLLAYVKRLEEREMEARFGQEYQTYRQRTPFLIPRLRRSAGNGREDGRKQRL